MSPTVRERLIQRAVSGRYDLFLGVGAGLTILGLILFIQSLLAGEAYATRAWQLFHVNWIYFTGLAGGSVAFAAVQKITNAKWSGMMIRFAEAAVAFLPISLIGLILIFTAGYDSIYGPMQVAMQDLPHSKAVWLSHGFMFGRLGLGLLAMTVVGWKLVRADMTPDMYAVKAVAGRAAAALRAVGAAATIALQPLEHEAGIHRLAPLYVVLLCLRFYPGGVRRDHGPAAALVLQPAGRLCTSWDRFSAATCSWPC